MLEHVGAVVIPHFCSLLAPTFRGTYGHRQPRLITVLCSARSYRVSPPQTENKQMRVPGGSDLPLVGSKCPVDCWPIRSVSSWPWWSRHDLDSIKGLWTILFLSESSLDTSTHIEEQMTHRSWVGGESWSISRLKNNLSTRWSNTDV